MRCCDSVPVFAKLSFLGDPERREYERRSAKSMTLEQANYLTSGLRILVSECGLTRHRLSSEWTRGTYVSQFESPVHGRMVIVNLDDDGAFGFQLEEIELLSDGQSRASDVLVDETSPPAPETRPSNETAEPSGEGMDSSSDADAPGN